MRLLTIGAGYKGAKIAELLHKEGVKVNKVPLFKCFAVLNDIGNLKNIALTNNRKFYIYGLRGDVGGILNEMLSIPELIEGSLVITSLEDDFGYFTSLELCKKLKGVIEDVVIALGIVPQLDTSSIGEIKKRIRSMRENSDVLILFEDKEGVENNILDVFNFISLAGEIDLKKKVAGEVVIDTSDIFNALRCDGFTVVGYSVRKIPFSIRKFIFRKNSELKAVKTKRMIDLTNEALNNLSINGDIEDAKSALLLFTGDPDEMTMEGLFSSISILESINRDIVIRYGDYPLPKSRTIATVILFSGIKKLKFS